MPIDWLRAEEEEKDGERVNEQEASIGPTSERTEEEEDRSGCNEDRATQEKK